MYVYTVSQTSIKRPLKGNDQIDGLLKRWSLKIGVEGLSEVMKNTKNF